MLLLVLLIGSIASAQQASVEGPENDSDHLAKLSDDVLWHLELSDIAEVRTFRYTGLPSGGSNNPMILYAYSYIPRNLDRTQKVPLIVLVHGGIHSKHMTGGPANAANIVREMMSKATSWSRPITGAAPATAPNMPRRSTTAAGKMTTCSARAIECWSGIRSSTRPAWESSAGATAA